MGKNFNPFSSSKPQGAQKESQLPTRLLQLAKPKENKDKKKKKKKGKGGEQTQTGMMNTFYPDINRSSPGFYLYIFGRLFGSMGLLNKGLIIDCTMTQTELAFILSS